MFQSLSSENTHQFSSLHHRIQTILLRQHILEDIKSTEKYQTVTPDRERLWNDFMFTFIIYFQIFQNLTLDKTPQIRPIDHDASYFIMTPPSAPTALSKSKEFMEEFMLEQNDDFSLEPRCESRKKKTRNQETTDQIYPYLFWMENQLERIIEHDQEDSGEQDQSLLSENEECEEIFDNEKHFQKTNSIQTTWSLKLPQIDGSPCKDPQQEAQSTIDLSTAEFTENIQRFSKHPKTEIIKQIKDIQKNNDETEEVRKEMIKKYLSKCLLEHETYCYEESWNQLGDNLKKTVKTIIQGLQETFSKKICNLSFQVRRTKLLKYLEKKKRRIWKKKVSYCSRKKVADGRLRIKGKFVTREQACEQLGLENLQYLNAEEIKEILQHRLDEGGSSHQLC